MAKVDILLATYNGEEFIAEQLDSILAQSFKDFRILIRDDGSSDNTLKIIQSYAEKFPGVIKIIQDSAICKHPTKNFLHIMQYATADYVMFSDQDDYWRPYKIQISLDSIQAAEKKSPGKPVLIFSGIELTDKNLEPLNRIGNELTEREEYKNFSRVILGNCVTGCSMIVNKALYEKIGDYDDCMTGRCYHDHWLAMFACGCGVIEYLPMSMILHRIHGKNHSDYGEPNTARDIILKPFKKFSSSKKTFFDLHSWALLFKKRYERFMYPEKLKELEDYLGLFDKNLLVRLKSFRKLNKTVNPSIREKFLWFGRIFLF